MIITIDHTSGFCSGVTKAIYAAEKELKTNKRLYCLGDLVHNSAEMERLRSLGLEVITHEQFRSLKNERVLIRAHGEPPSTYQIASKNSLTLLDYTCPVVLKLQQRIRKELDFISSGNGQVVIYGKQGHAEVTGLSGQIDNRAIIISSPDDVSAIEMTRPVLLFSQTTQDENGFYRLAENIKSGMTAAGADPEKNLQINNTICRLVSKKVPQLKAFASRHDIIIFVSGLQSSNGQFLYSLCREVNSRSYFISQVSELQAAWFSANDSVGICGATSTPMWLMEKVEETIRKLCP